MISPFPEMGGEVSQAQMVKNTKRRTVGLALCVACIFFGACAENAMTNWISSFMETALGVDKTLGDILGLALFATLLASTRMIYAKFGKKIMPVLLFGMIGSVICYLVAGLSPSAIPAFIACVLTGVSVAMLWPGSLIMMEENMPSLGVAAYALMAAGGDLGSSFAPQLVGIIVDKVSAFASKTDLTTQLGMAAEQIGLKAGMLVCAIFPLIGVVVVLVLMRFFKTKKTEDNL